MIWFTRIWILILRQSSVSSFSGMKTNSSSSPSTVCPAYVGAAAHHWSSCSLSKHCSGSPNTLSTDGHQLLRRTLVSAAKENQRCEAFYHASTASWCVGPFVHWKGFAPRTGLQFRNWRVCSCKSAQGYNLRSSKLKSKVPNLCMFYHAYIHTLQIV